MNKLIILNGPTGVGKSSIATLLHKSIDFSFLLDIDTQRRFINNYHSDANRSRFLIYEISKSILEKCIQNSIDVIIDKIIIDPEVLDDFINIAKDNGGEVVEFILWAPKDIVMNRVKQRGIRENSKLFTYEKAEKFWDSINELIPKRKDAHVIETDGKNFEEILEVIENLL